MSNPDKKPADVSDATNGVDQMPEDRRVEEMRTIMRVALANLGGDTRNLSREILRDKIEFSARILRAALEE